MIDMSERGVPLCACKAEMFCLYYSEDGKVPDYYFLYRRNFKSFFGGQIPLYFSAYFLFHTYSYERIDLLFSTIEDHLYCQGWSGEYQDSSPGLPQ
jgi:hypothetical protein